MMLQPTKTIDGIDENNYVIKADIRDGKYTLSDEQYFKAKYDANEEPDIDEWVDLQHDYLDQLKYDLAKFYEIETLPNKTIEKIFSMAWDVAWSFYDDETDDEEAERIETIQLVADIFADLADMFKL